MPRWTLCCLLVALVAPRAWAAPAVALPLWQIDMARSTIEFSAEQAGARFVGRFSQWRGDIQFDAKDLPHSRALVRVQVASISTQNADRDSALKSADWFESARWPEARFETVAIRASGAGFVADARLTIRGHTRPVRFIFQATKSVDGGWRLTGTAHLARLEFELGGGDFKSTQWVGNDVEVRVVVLARSR